MEIKGNKTFSYLTPVLKYLDLGSLTHVIKDVNSFHIGDRYYSKIYGDSPYKMFVTFKVTNKGTFDRFLSSFRSNKNYCYDYIQEGIVERHLHTVVIDIQQYKDKYDNFVWSKYSKIYNMEELSELGLNNPKLKIYNVLTRKSKAIAEAYINELYGTNITFDDDREFDVPINHKEEFLNF